MTASRASLAMLVILAVQVALFLGVSSVARRLAIATILSPVVVRR